MSEPLEIGPKWHLASLAGTGRLRRLGEPLFLLEKETGQHRSQGSTGANTEAFAPARSLEPDSPGLGDFCSGKAPVPPAGAAVLGHI